VSSVYNKLGAPVMSNVTVKVDIEGASESGSTSRVYPKEVYDLFAGEQLVMVGRYKKPGSAKITITGKVSGKEQKFDFPASFVERSSDQSHAFVEKLWAMRRIGEIIDEIDLKGKNDELVKELVGLSTKHGILTPYTSFLADETSTVRSLADTRLHLERAKKSVERLTEAEGISGVSQRAEKFEFQSARLARNASSPAFGGAAPMPGPGGPGGGRGVGSAAPAGRATVGPLASTPALQAQSAGQGQNYYRDIDSDQLIVAHGVQNAGKETLYKRGRMWIANNAKDVDPEKDTVKIQEIKRFSDDYFALVRANTQDENAVLATQQEGEELLVRFRGQAYLVK
jgi:Ca-activated chloride channel family protein